ncbi:hypothetical protein B296_00037783, partial [Ensete ventricosum]
VRKCGGGSEARQGRNRSMGGCFSDVRGGQQAVGSGGPAAGAAPQELNDAMGYFLHSRGLRGLFTTLEVRCHLRNSSLT